MGVWELVCARTWEESGAQKFGNSWLQLSPNNLHQHNKSFNKESGQGQKEKLKVTEKAKEFRIRR